MSFKPADELEALIYAGDGDTLLERLEAMPEPQRLALADRLAMVADLMHYTWYDREVIHESWGMRATDGQRDAIAAAMLVCAPAAKAASFTLPAGRVVALAARFRPPSLPTLAQEFWDRSHPAAALQLAQAGLSPFSLDDDGVLRLMALQNRLRMKMRDYLREYIDTLKPVLLRMFDVEGTSEINLASIDKYTFQDEGTWAWNLHRLCEDGVYPRAELLSLCLGTLERDWPQFRAGWFSRFHDRLAPTLDEMGKESERYAALLHSRIPPTVTMALKACTKLFDKKLIDSVTLQEALRPVMLSAVKAQITGALKLLDAMVKREASAAHAASRVALDGLQHTDPELQQAIVARLEKWGMDEDTRAAAQGTLSYLAQSVQPALAALLGESSQQEEWHDIELPAARAPLSPLDPSRKLELPAGLDDLVALCAQVLEDESDLDRVEAALGALLQAMPLNEDARSRFAPVLKRARKLNRAEHRQYEFKGCVSREFARLLLAVAGERVASPWSANKVTGVLAARMDELAATGSALDIATHRGGYIDPAVLVQRTAALGADVARLPLTMQVRALLRLAPGSHAAALTAAQALPATPFQQALCYALGSDWPSDPVPELCVAAARIRHPGADDPRAILAFGGDMADGAAAAKVTLRTSRHESKYGDYWQAHGEVSVPTGGYDSGYLAAFRYQHFWVESEPLIMFGASLFPSSREALYATALPEMAAEVQWHEANWHLNAYLRLLADPTAEITPCAALALAFGLMGGEPGQVAMAVDAFVSASLDGRLAAADLGNNLLSVAGSYFMAGRLARSLATAANAADGMPAVVVTILGKLCELPVEQLPRDFAKLLQLMRELVLQQRLRPAADALAALSRLALTGKALVYRNEILALAAESHCSPGTNSAVCCV